MWTVIDGYGNPAEDTHGYICYISKCFCLGCVFWLCLSAANTLRASGLPSTAAPTGEITFSFALLNLNCYEGVLLLQGWQFKRAEKISLLYLLMMLHLMENGKYYNIMAESVLKTAACNTDSQITYIEIKCVLCVCQMHRCKCFLQGMHAKALLERQNLSQKK